ncbi:cytochrome c oxidase assembly protein [Streptomyces sp. SID3343]|uniref:cytochrome c oxidase assembly protein n=1 Tax=Streptomyces sp. SID3343 TaxID=2690260 RepID=UPI00136AB970|nr:cytochrome c oxidase assembly protein [Streptomyces sp. SID3343]MYW06321.1 cytochrome c oxidase assembly protein [Streptomyces sp. SID3343]
MSSPTASAVAHATHVPPFDGTRVVTEWTFEPLTAVAAVLLGAAYLVGVRRVRARGGRWRPSHTGYFVGLGLGMWVLATMSFLGVYQDVLFWPRAVQNMLLLMVVPLFLAEGAPLTLLRENLSPAAVARLGRIRRGRLAVGLTFPLFPSAVFVLTPFVLYLSGWYPATLHGGALPHVTRLVLVAIGAVYFWTRVQADPVPRRYPHLVSMWLTFVEVVFDGALGLYIMLGNHLIAGDHYTAIARAWGPSLQRDQVLGGGALWFTGDAAGLPFLAILLIRMIREDAHNAAEIDRELDARAADRRKARRSASPDAANTTDTAKSLGTTNSPEDDGPEMMPPWWETDPRFANRYGRTHG